MSELRSFDDVKLLTVVVDLLRQWWRPGLLLIGPALLGVRTKPCHDT